MLRPFATACLVAVASLGWTGWAEAVDCSTGDVLLRSQGAVDSLGARDCDTVPGSLIIQGSNANSITSLQALTNITTVGNTLQIGGNVNNYSVGNDLLITLDGLNNITSVGGLAVSFNDILTDLDGLSSLEQISGSVWIGGNSALTDIDGLANVTRVRSITIGGTAGILSNGNPSGNPALTNIDGLANLTSVGDDLFIYNNGALTNIDGLASVTSVGDDLYISNNAALTNVDGLANVTSAGGFLQIRDNYRLINVDGLASVTSVGDDLYISNNAALTNVDGLANVTSVGDDLNIQNNNILPNVDGLINIASVGGLLAVVGNTSMSSCEGVALLLGWPNGPPDDSVNGSISINSNSTRCNSLAEVIASVSGPTQPAIIAAKGVTGGVTLDFSASTTTDALFPVVTHEAACTGPSAEVTESPASALLDNTPVTRTLTVSGYDPVSVLSDIEVDIDITHSDPTDLYITITTPQGTELVLWDTNLSSGSEDLIGTFPTTLMPIDSLSSVSDEALDGVWTLLVEDQDVGPIVREGVLNSWGLRLNPEANKATGADSPITVSGITRGRNYACTVAPVTGLGTLPVSDAVTAKSDFPTTPTVTSTDYEDGTIRLTVSVADNGGADITEYSASCTDGTSTFTGTSSTPTIEVTGLTNGTAYTCSASATNAVGSSGASASTDSITPEALPTGLPIWLLYEATK